MEKLSYVDETGKASMADVGAKEIQRRSAKASGHIKLSDETLGLIRDNLVEKGDVLTLSLIHISEPTRPY